MNSPVDIGRIFLLTALGMLVAALFAGILSGLIYLYPGFLKDQGGFSMLRPFHVSSAMFWILLGATGGVYCSLQAISGKSSAGWSLIQLLLWIVAIIGIFHSYISLRFGGREYWEFPPVWALLIACAWFIFLAEFIKAARNIRKWPVYVWMWMTGIIFFLFSFTENYLWLFPFFREHFIADTTIQWKVNGSLVGAWNQILYGTAFFLMDRISGDRRAGHSRLVFAMYFLGLFNLMFNWGHHIYTLPTENYVRYLGYFVSMTEWIIFARIIFTWKQSLTDIQKHYHYFPYRFLMAADIWVFLNIAQALLMSIPGINLYTHGTHITVAHAMGTTIGINSMILLAVCFEFLGDCAVPKRNFRPLNILFWLVQGALLIFWLSLNGAGFTKAIWQMSAVQVPFRQMMDSLRPWLITFVASGSVLLVSLASLAVYLITVQFRCFLAKKRKITIINETIETSVYAKTSQLQ